MSDRFEPPFLIGVDIGSRSVRTLAFDVAGHQVAQARRPTPQRRLPDDRCEYDPARLFSAVVECLSETARALAGRAVAGIAVASIGESCVLLDEAGQPVAPSIAWFDMRTEEETRMLRETVGIERLFAITGLQLNPTFTLCKLMWMKANWPDALRRTRRILQIADWIAFCLSGVAATDFTLASRTLYLDLQRRQWSDELIALTGLDTSLLAPLTPGGTPLGVARPEVLAATGLAGKPVVAVGAHDHICGAVAAGIGTSGNLINSVGTAEVVVLAATQPSFDEGLGKLDHMQGALGFPRLPFYLGASLVSSGGTIEWFRKSVGEPPHETLIDEGQAALPGSGGVIFLPDLVQSSLPDRDHPVRGAFLGLTIDAGRGALYRAVLEGLAMRVAMDAETLAGLLGIGAPGQIRLIGGGSRNPLLVALKANAFGRPVTVIEQPETTALGAAILGGIGAGLWPDLDAALAAIDRRERVVEPDLALVELYREMRQAVFRKLQPAMRTVDVEMDWLAALSARVPGNATVKS